MIVDFIDKIEGIQQTGTPLSRKNLMAIQGFSASETRFGENTIEQKNLVGDTLTTTLNADGSIMEVFSAKVSGYVLKKKTTFENGLIKMEVIN